MSSTVHTNHPFSDSDSAHLGTSDVRFRRIVVATDFAAPARCALQISAGLAAQFDAELSVVHAASPFLCSTGDQPIPYEVLEQNLRDIKAELANQISAVPLRMARDPRCFVGYGDPVQLICDAARTQSADLIVVGTHGATGLERLALGSVAECVLRGSLCPVLLVGPHCKPVPQLFRSILFATDLKHTGLRPAQYAAALAEHTHGRLTCIHILRYAPGTSAEEQAARESKAMHEMAMLLPGNLPSNCIASLKVEVGQPAECIEVHALLESASLIILGVRERFGFEDHSPHSTLAHVTRNARCPVLGIRSHLA